MYTWSFWTFERVLKYTSYYIFKHWQLFPYHLRGFPGGASGKESARNEETPVTWAQSCVGKIPWRKAWQPTPVFLQREFHGQGSLVGYSPYGCKESDTTEHAHTPNHRTKAIKLPWTLNINISGTLNPKCFIFSFYLPDEPVLFIF